MQNFDHNIGFEKNAEVRKSQKIVIITSTPGRLNLACLILCFFSTLSDTVSPRDCRNLNLFDKQEFSCAFRAIYFIR
jgi:hypothetical protein